MRRRPKGYAEKMRALKSKLRYQQMYYRIESKSLKSRKETIREIVQKMRELIQS